MGKTQLVPAGYVVNKNGLGGVGVGPQQNRNSHFVKLIHQLQVRIQAEPIHGKYLGVILHHFEC